MLAVDRLELLPATALAVEQLQHHDAGDVLLKVCINLGDGHADAAVALGHAAAEDARGEDHEGHGGHHDGGQRRTEPQHGGDDE